MQMQIGGLTNSLQLLHAKNIASLYFCQNVEDIDITVDGHGQNIRDITVQFKKRMVQMLVSWG